MWLEKWITGYDFQQKWDKYKYSWSKYKYSKFNQVQTHVLGSKYKYFKIMSYK